MPTWFCRVLRLSALVIVSSLAGCESSPSLRDPYSAVVGPTSARFTFPLPDVDSWNWDLPSTQAGEQEYQWEVEVRNAGETFMFGYSRYKVSTARPREGDVRTLIRSGQASVWQKRTDGGASLFRDASIDVRAEDGDRLVLWIIDSWTRNQLFGDQPDSVTFVWKLPETERQFVRAPVTYVDELQFY